MNGGVLQGHTCANRLIRVDIHAFGMGTNNLGHTACIMQFLIEICWCETSARFWEIGLPTLSRFTAFVIGCVPTLVLIGVLKLFDGKLRGTMVAAL